MAALVADVEENTPNYIENKSLNSRVHIKKRVVRSSERPKIEKIWHYFQSFPKNIAFKKFLEGQLTTCLL